MKRAVLICQKNVDVAYWSFFFKTGPFFKKISSLVIYMNYSFVILIEHDDDAEKLENCMMQHSIGFECDIIGDKHLIYEFTIDDEHRIAIDLIKKHNNITVLKFIYN
jgi:hypothetical protein